MTKTKFAPDFVKHFLVRKIILKGCMIKYCIAKYPVKKAFTVLLTVNPDEEEESDLHNDVVTFYGVSAAIVHF